MVNKIASGRVRVSGEGLEEADAMLNEIAVGW